VKRAALIGIAALASCTKPQATCPSIEVLARGDAVADARAALARGDRHLLMLGGFVGVVPGVRDSGAFPTRVIEGTSDTTTDACRRERSDAEPHARKYNQTVVRGG
jgi:hypothetical protein